MMVGAKKLKVVLATLFAITLGAGVAQAQIPGYAPSGQLFANSGASAATGRWTTATAWLDRWCGSTQGMVAIRGASSWACSIQLATTSTDNALVRYDGTSGSQQNSSFATLSDGGVLDVAAPSVDRWQVAPAAGSVTFKNVSNGSLIFGTNNTTAATISSAQVLSLVNPLPVTSGGTGLATFAQGDMLYASAANTLAALAKNTSATRYLSNTGSSNNPAWAQVVLTTGVSDYEEGSWTPVLAGSTTAGTQTYTTQIGRYIRKGNEVTVWWNIIINTKDGATAGNMRVTGLPFATSVISGFSFTGTVGLHSSWDLNTAGGYYAMAAIAPAGGGTHIDFYEVGDNIGGTNLTAADFISGSAVFGTLTYRIN